MLAGQWAPGKSWLVVISHPSHHAISSPKSYKYKLTLQISLHDFIHFKTNVKKSAFPHCWFWQHKKKYLTLKCSINDLKFMKHVIHIKIILIISESKGKGVLKMEFQRIKAVWFVRVFKQSTPESRKHFSEKWTKEFPWSRDDWGHWNELWNLYHD